MPVEQNNITPLLYASQPQNAAMQQAYQQQLMQMQQEQMLAQQYQNSADNFKQTAQTPNQFTPQGNTIPQSTVGNVARMLAQGFGAQQQNQGMDAQLQAQQMQMKLMAQALQQPGNATVGNGNGNGAFSRAQMMQANLYDQQSPGLGQKWLDSQMPTPDMKTAGSVGMNPLQYQGATAGQSANAGAAVKPYQVNPPNGQSYLTNELGAAGGGQPPTVSAGTPLPPPTGFSQAGGAIPPIAAGVPGQPANPARGSLTASEAGIPTPPQEANITTGGMVGGMPLSGAANTQLASAVNNPPPAPSYGQQVASAQQSMQGGLQVQSPAQAEAAKAVALSPINAQAEGAKLAQTNHQTYLQGLDKKISEGADNVQLANDEDDLAQLLHTGSGQEAMTKAAGILQRMGAPQSLVNKIAGGDNTAIGAAQAFASIQALHGAKQAMAMMAQGGSQSGRVAASTLQSFTDNLADTAQQGNAISSINAVARQLYFQDLAERKAEMADRAEVDSNGKPLNDPTTFQARYGQMRGSQLLSGRSSNPVAALKAATPPSNPQQPSRDDYIQEAKRRGLIKGE